MDVSALDLHSSEPKLKKLRVLLVQFVVTQGPQVRLCG
jgi:hypothetical protein